MRLLRLLPLVALAGCADLPTETAEATAVDDSKTDSATELRVRAGETTLWIDRTAVRRSLDGGEYFAMRGRTSRDLTEGSAFIFDDINADWVRTGTRSFEVRWSTTAGALDMFRGVQQFARLHFRPSSGRPDSLTARALLRPRLRDLYGSSRIYLTAELTPYLVGGRAVLRLRGSTTSDIRGVTVELDGVALPPAEVRATDSRHIVADIADESFLLAAGTTAKLVVRAELAAGTYTKTARAALSVKTVGLTTGDPYEVWPPVECSDEVRACVGALPAGSIDTSACGLYVEVNVCGGSAGAVVDDVAFSAALGRADAVLAADFAADAPALVGGDRVDAFSFNVRESIQGRLEPMFGRIYPDAAGRDAALDAAAAEAIDAAYARPLDLLDGPHEPIPGDLAQVRQIAADRLLLELAGMDLTTTEYGRSLTELARLYRAQYVADLRYFREEVEPEDVVGTTYLIGRVLGSHTEMRIDLAAGTVLSVLFEID